MQSETCRAEGTAAANRGEDERSIERILARWRARKRRRRHTHPPGSLHGDCRLDAVYETFGSDWTEGTAFVQPVCDPDGDRLGWTAATFEERFLTIAHGVRGEVPDCELWLHGELESVERAVLLELGNPAGGVELEVPSTIPVRTRRERLVALEREYLSATRDRDFRPRGTRGAPKEQRLLESRVDVMSLIGLCARLVESNR